MNLVDNEEATKKLFWGIPVIMYSQMNHFYELMKGKIRKRYPYLTYHFHQCKINLKKKIGITSITTTLSVRIRSNIHFLSSHFDCLRPLQFQICNSAHVFS